MTRRKVEVRKHTSLEYGEINALFIDDELFDWGIDTKSMQEAILFARDNATMRKALHGDVQNHFLECLGEGLRYKITIKEVNKAIELGYIDC